MTLLIAFILIYQFEFNGAWYLAVLVVWGVRFVYCYITMLAFDRSLTSISDIINIIYERGRK